MHMGLPILKLQLRSTINSKGVIMDFTQTQQAYIHLKDQLEQGHITADEFESRVNEMTVTDSAGVLWQIGVKTGKWYRYDGQGWVEDTPREFSGINADFAPLVTPQNVQPYQNQEQPQGNKWVGGLLIGGILAACCVIVVIGGWFIWSYSPSPAPFTPPAASSLTPPSIPLALTTESGNTAFPAFPPDLVQFQDDFSNPGSGWDDVRVGEDFNTLYFEDVYLFVITSADFYAWANPNREFPSDVHVEVDARKTSGSQYDEYGLLCRYAKNSDGTHNYYYFAIAIDGLGVIYKIDHDEKSLIITDPPKNRSDVIHPGDQSNRIRGDCIGDTLTLYVNGQSLITAVDSSFTGGDVGLRVDSETGETEIRFDNFIVFKPGY